MKPQAVPADDMAKQRHIKGRVNGSQCTAAAWEGAGFERSSTLGLEAGIGQPQQNNSTTRQAVAHWLLAWVGHKPVYLVQDVVAVLAWAARS